MRLQKVYLHGYKRFLRPTKLLVGRQLTALIGLNEAGKSSILTALQSFGHMNWAEDDLNMRRGRDSHPVIRADFTLDDDDIEAFGQLSLAVVPTQFSLFKGMDGVVNYSIHPQPAYSSDVAVREDADRAISSMYPASNNETAGLLHFAFALAHKPLFDLQVQIKRRQTLTPETLHLLSDLAEGTSSHYDGRPAEQIKTYQDVFSRFRKTADLHARSAPHRVAGHLGSRLPRFLLFNSAEDMLPARTDLTDLTDEAMWERSPLMRLILFGGQSTRQLMTYVQEKRAREATSLLAMAQREINRVIAQQWPAGAVEVQLKLNGWVLELHVAEQSTAEYLHLVSRSQGLRYFLALLAFIHRYTHDATNLIVLIDEIETHLHVDAQRRVVQALERLPPTRQIIYTTHSPFALPGDLSGVREVQPSAADGTSTIENHIWREFSGGLLGLYVRMGAASASVSAARAALVVEGESDFVVLPRMLNEVLGRPLDVLCLPGYAHAKRRPLYYEGEAVRVAYLFDGDRPGQQYARLLKRCKVPESRVFTLAPDTELEDYLDPTLYLNAVQTHLSEHRQPPLPLTAADLPGPDRHGQLEQKCKALGRSAPKKTEIMAKVLELWSMATLRLDEGRRSQFSVVAEKIEAALSF